MINKKQDILKFLKVIALFLPICVLISFFVYRSSNKMTTATAFEINEVNLFTKVLIATQGSSFKNDLTKSVLNELEKENYFIKVIDVKSLEDIKAEDWTAIVIMHTWEYWKPQEDAAEFIRENKTANNLMVIATSGGGDEMMDEIDGWSSASVLTNVPFLTEQITIKVQKLVDASPHSRKIEEAL